MLSSKNSAGPVHQTSLKLNTDLEPAYTGFWPIFDSRQKSSQNWQFAKPKFWFTTNCQIVQHCLPE